MRKAVKIVVVIFFIIMAFFTVFQYFVGNPFFDDIHPVITTAIFLAMGITAFFLVFRKK